MNNANKFLDERLRRFNNEYTGVNFRLGLSDYIKPNSISSESLRIQDLIKSKYRNVS